ncbi:MAG: hypothetical protein NTW87_22450 [Planctomycetota bacterium]|nr:hypothetical protein [Planctomycetota bacterium]
MKSMMLILCTVCVACLVTARAGDEVPPKAHPDSKGWENLFAEDLSNAVYPKGVWTFQDGVLTATQD